MKNRFRFKLEKFYHHDYFAPGVCVLFLEPSYFPRTYRSAEFCSLLGHFSRFCASNLLQLCYIAALLSFSFSAFFLPTNFLSVVPLLDLVFHLFSRHAPAIAIIVLSKTLPISLHPSSQELEAKDRNAQAKAKDRGHRRKLSSFYLFKAFLTKYVSQHHVIFNYPFIF